MEQITRNALPMCCVTWKTAWIMNLTGPGTKICVPWSRRWFIIVMGSHRLRHRIPQKFPVSKKDTGKYWKQRKKNMNTFLRAIITETDIIYTWEWRNIWVIISCFFMITEYPPLIMKPNGFWGIIRGNRRRPCHSGVSTVSIISANAWACWLWCAKKKRQIYLTEYPRSLDKRKTDGFWLISVYTIGFLNAS